MTPLRVLLSRLLGKGRTHRELDTEIAAHLSLLAADYERRGLSPSDALAAARRHFGPIAQLHETYRDQRRLPILDSLSQDLAYSFRQLRRNPGFAAAAVLTLALGIGANAAIYQVLDAVSVPLTPGPRPRFAGSDSTLREQPAGPRKLSFISAIGRRATGLRRTFCVERFPAPPGRSPRPRILPPRSGAPSSPVTTSTSSVSPPAPAASSPKTTTAPPRPPVIVLSDAFWNREFGRSPSAIGQVLEINGASGTVIGVTPPEFFGETVGTVPDVWLPISFQPQFMPADWLNAPSHSWLTMMGRLRPGTPHAKRRTRSTRSTVGSRCRPRNSRSASIVSNCNRPVAASTFWNNVSDDRSGCWSASPAWCS